MKANAKRQQQDLREQERRSHRMKVTVGTAAAIVAAAVALFFFLPAAGSSSSEHDNAPSGFRRMTIDEFKPQFDRDGITVIDVRDRADFLQSHIPGALHIPLARIGDEIDSLPKGKPIVTYCSCPAEESSGAAAQILERRGIPAVAALQGGFQEWRRRGYPAASGSS